MEEDLPSLIKNRRCDSNSREAVKSTSTAPLVPCVYCNRIGCNCPKVLTVDGTDVTGTVPRK
jgi:hypothetical protein